MVKFLFTSETVRTPFRSMFVVHFLRKSPIPTCPQCTHMSMVFVSVSEFSVMMMAVFGLAVMFVSMAELALVVSLVAEFTMVVMLVFSLALVVMSVTEFTCVREH
ncbi:hypothetical protein M8J77_009388 [Diaphorina citri]|nr:hypothetical protein M8J77_009388 [Diaphorina citri]